eukprot:c43952_g1_i1 orf=82-618(+)
MLKEYCGYGYVYGYALLRIHFKPILGFLTRNMIMAMASKDIMYMWKEYCGYAYVVTLLSRNHFKLILGFLTRNCDGFKISKMITVYSEVGISASLLLLIGHALLEAYSRLLRHCRFFASSFDHGILFLFVDSIGNHFKESVLEWRHLKLAPGRDLVACAAVGCTDFVPQIKSLIGVVH